MPLALLKSCGPRGGATILQALAGAFVIAFGQAQVYAGEGYDHPVDLSKPPALSFEQVKSIVQKNHVRSIEQLLPLLPEKYRKYYIFMYQSHSLQSANPAQPRVILYGPDARFIMSFSGDPLNGDSNTLEMIEFDSKSKSFAPKEIVFPRLNSGSVRIDEKPKNCTGCHDEPFHPIWDPYNSWRGAYGSASRGFQTRITKGSNEEKFYQSFLQNERHFGRYAFLPAEITQGAVAGDRVSARNAASEDPTGLFTQHIGELNFHRIEQYISSAPNYSHFKYVLAALAMGCVFDLGQPTSRDEAERVFKKAKTLEGNQAIERFFPKPLQDEMRDFLTLRASMAEIGKKDFEIRKKEIEIFNPLEDPNGKGLPVSFLEKENEIRKTSDLGELTKWRYVIERMNLDMENWSLAFDHGVYELENGGERAVDQVGKLLLVQMRADPDLSPLLQHTSNPVFLDPDWVVDIGLRDACEKLRIRSLAALSAEPGSDLAGGVCIESAASVLGEPKIGLELLEQKIATPKRPRALTTCISCHSGPNAVAKPIPFHDESALTIAMKKDGLIEKAVERLHSSVPNHRMPPDSDDLSPEDRDAIVAYLRSLAN